MTKLIFLAVLLFVAGFVIKLLKGLDTAQGTSEGEWLPYAKKSYLLTRAEREFFGVLEQAVAGKYYIFTQIALDKIVLLKGQGSRKGGYRNKINKKSVDFLLADKENISPVLVIELDDHTHDRADRVDRDEFVDRVLDHCQIPILHVRLIPGAEELRILIEKTVREQGVGRSK